METMRYQKSREEQTIRFEQEGTYFFTVEDAYRTGDKTVVVGRFLENKNVKAPKGQNGERLELDRLYCLKKATVSFDDGNKYPQHRNHWDFMEYEGEHLREILAVNDEVIRMETDMACGEHVGKTYACAAIEPVYHPIVPDDFTSRQKIDIMLQIVAGLQELKAIKIGRGEITAHRDIKFSNAMLELLESGEFRVRLIDFSSIKIKENRFDPNQTVVGAFSRSNTAPEDVLSRFEVSDKTDVFALGLMLAEIFDVWRAEDLGTSNPLAILFDLDRDEVKLENREQCARYYQRLIDEYGDDREWLEKVLNRACFRRWPVDSVGPGVQELFYASVSLIPDARIELEEFARRLVKIRESFPAEPEEVNYSLCAFLVDCTDFSQYRDRYEQRALEIIRKKEKTAAHFICYQRTADPMPLHMESLAIQISEKIGAKAAHEIEHEFRSIQNYTAGENEKSDLLGALGFVSRCLEHKSYRERFDGEIHVFTKTAPIKEEMRLLVYKDPKPLGGSPERAHTAESICETMGNPRICVHCDSLGNGIESWYTVRLLSGDDIFGKGTELYEDEPGNGIVFFEEE